MRKKIYTSLRILKGKNHKRKRLTRRTFKNPILAASDYIIVETININIGERFIVEVSFSRH